MILVIAYGQKQPKTKHHFDVFVRSKFNRKRQKQKLEKPNNKMWAKARDKSSNWVVVWLCLFPMFLFFLFLVWCCVTACSQKTNNKTQVVFVVLLVLSQKPPKHSGKMFLLDVGLCVCVAGFWLKPRTQHRLLVFMALCVGFEARQS